MHSHEPLELSLPSQPPRGILPPSPSSQRPFGGTTLVVVPRRQRSKDKIVTDRRSLAAILSGLRASGKVVVVTNGVFDLLHVGHTRCLEDARSRGDVLVVAINSDKSAEALKGKGHPVVEAEERLEVLAALSFVDYVTVFEEGTADLLLEQLRPNLYAKGTDYTLKTLPEKDTLKKHDIKAVFVGDKKAHSSSKLIQKIRKRKFD
ncbi:MAG: adenylyltransferase/cytidyltransferase family protein [Planctomycetes bacterium]|nr:adenylyltransferase/cytidyltransferase family protein [Planctomycetota bacterium]